MKKALGALAFALMISNVGFFATPQVYANNAAKFATVNTGESASVSHRKDGAIEFVEAHILINQRPEKVWPILSNPFEFEASISPRFKTTDVLVDKPDVSLMKCTVDTGFLLPSIKYTVESHYDHGKKITFRSTEGSLKDFRGSWELKSAENGTASYVTYSMYVEPGIPVPQWIVRQGIRMELPHTLEALRDRVEDICAGRGTPPVHRSISASGEITASAPRLNAG